MGMDRIRSIVEGTDTREGKLFDWAVLVLILIAIVEFSLETLPGLDAQTLKLLKQIELVITGLFTLEYILRVVVAKKKPDYIFSFYGIVDLVAIAPFYLSLGVDLRAMRAFRFFRLVSLFKLARYSKAIDRFRRALMIAKEEIVLFLIVATILIYLAAVGIYYFEHEVQPEKFASIFHSLWWATTSLTTVGYGDAYPITTGGKIFTFFVLMIGLGIIAVPPGLIATALSEARADEEE
jgi:voltage-gated potassium channel